MKLIVAFIKSSEKVRWLFSLSFFKESHDMSLLLPKVCRFLQFHLALCVVYITHTHYGGKSHKQDPFYTMWWISASYVRFLPSLLDANLPMRLLVVLPLSQAYL